MIPSLFYFIVMFINLLILYMVMRTGVKVSDAMTREPISVNPNDDLMKCTNIMLNKQVGSVVIKNADKVVGIITEKDIVERLVAKGKVAKETLAKDIMSTSLISIKSNSDIYDAMQKMRETKVRRLLVFNKDAFLGLITYKDILKIQPSLFDLMAERFNIREEETKPLYGKCNNCSSETYLYRVGNKILCEACK